MAQIYNSVTGLFEEFEAAPPSAREWPEETAALWQKEYVGNFMDCYHNWQSYVGFSESYEYCSKCDKRK